MHVTLQPTTSANALTIANLLQLYLHDLSPAEARDVDAHGLFPFPDLARYESDPNYAAFCIHADGQLCGFALTHCTSRVHGAFDGHVVAAFFVLRRYRGCGIGRAAATQLFDAFPGLWEVSSTTTNVPAHCFWRSVIQEYTGGHYDEAWHSMNGWRGHIQTFQSPEQREMNEASKQAGE